MPRALSAMRLDSATTSSSFEQETHRGEAAVVQEAVSPEDDPLRIHDRRSRGTVLEGVVLEKVVVREHVMEAVPQVARRVSADDAVRRGLDVEAVANVV